MSEGPEGPSYQTGFLVSGCQLWPADTLLIAIVHFCRRNNWRDGHINPLGREAGVLLMGRRNMKKLEKKE